MEDKVQQLLAITKKLAIIVVKKLIGWLFKLFGPYVATIVIVAIILTTLFGSMASGDFNGDNKIDQVDENYVKPYKDEVNKVNPNADNYSFNNAEHNYLLSWGIPYAIDITGEAINLPPIVVQQHAKEMAQALKPKFTYTTGTVTTVTVRPEQTIVDDYGNKVKSGGTETHTINVNLLSKADTLEGITSFTYTTRTTTTISGDTTITRTEPLLAGRSNTDDFSRLDAVIKKFTGKKEVTKDDRAWIIQLAQGLKNKQENLDWMISKDFNKSAGAFIGEVPADMVPFFKAAGEKYNIPWTLLVAIAKVESSFDPGALGPLCDDGQRAEGLMQFKPSSWAWKGGIDGDGDGKSSPFNAADAIFSSANLLSYLMGINGGDLHKAVKSYGEGTDAYVDKVFGLADSYEYGSKVGASGYLWPVVGTNMSNISQYYGEKSATSPNGHGGLDIAAANGTPIQAMVDGTVTSTGSDPNGGNHLILQGADGNQWYFAHLSGYNVSEGQRVKQSDILCFVGSTGNSTGPHLHLELWVNGKKSDPLPLIQR